MSASKKTQIKTRLHLRNKNREAYDLKELVKLKPELKNFLIPNRFNSISVDFSNPKAVKILNQALLGHYYGVKKWDFPDKNLCPPIPGRADYIHYLADLLSNNNPKKIPEGNQVTCLDIGTGASCIYPILGVQEYGWDFIASDINEESILSANKIVQSNPPLKDKIKCVLQKNTSNYFKDVITNKSKIDLTLCNPPFHASLKDAQRGTQKKVKNLTGQKSSNTKLNFSGITTELVCEGGEYKFIYNMIKESKFFSKNCFWFTTLVSKEANLKGLQSLLQKEKAQVKVIPMGTGNKITRILAWTFLSNQEQKNWRESFKD